MRRGWSGTKHLVISVLFTSKAGSENDKERYVL